MCLMAVRDRCRCSSSTFVTDERVDAPTRARHISPENVVRGHLRLFTWVLGITDTKSTSFGARRRFSEISTFLAVGSERGYGHLGGRRRPPRKCARGAELAFKGVRDRVSIKISTQIGVWVMALSPSAAPSTHSRERARDDAHSHAQRERRSSAAALLREAVAHGARPIPRRGVVFVNTDTGHVVPRRAQGRRAARALDRRRVGRGALAVAQTLNRVRERA